MFGNPSIRSGKPIVKTYRGNQSFAQKLFVKDAELMAKKNYYPTSNQWSQGSWGGGAFIVALLLCFVLIGIIVFLYMLLVKPAGTLTVTYQYRELSQGDKVCPKCAESVKQAASVCRFCGHEFDQVN